METSSQWLNYYAVSLTDGDIFDVQPKDWEAGFFFENIGELDDSTKLAKIFQDLNKRRTTRATNESDEDTLPYINIFISPFFISRQVERGKGVNTSRTFPYWIPAKLNANGLLLPPDSQALPWVLRTSLDPVLLGRNEIPTIGHVNDVTQALNTFNFEYETWAEYLDSCEKFFEKLTKYDFKSYKLEDAIITHNPCLIAGKASNIASHILSTYTDLKSQKKLPNLLKEVLSNQWRPQIDIATSEELFLTNGHYGQYNNNFPLSFSQRQSLLSFVVEQEDKVCSSQYIVQAKQNIAESEIESRKSVAETQRKAILIISIVSILSVAALSVIVILFRRKQAAYRALVKKNQEWANSVQGVEGAFVLDPTDCRVDDDKDKLTPIGIDKPSEGVSKEDLAIMSRIFSFVVGQKQYTSPGFNLDTLSADLGINRKYLSKAINSATGKNFNTYINEYRVKEAIRLLSAPGNRFLSVDDIGMRVGFSNRSSFYESFRKMTGISPSQFKKTGKTIVGFVD